MEAKRVLSRAVKTLKASDSIDHWQKNRERIEAEDLLIHVMGYEPEPDEDIAGRDRREFEVLIERRATGEPIPYIKGYAEFRGIELRTKPGVFVPRDSSEFLAEQAVRRLRGRKKPVHVDLATGGGTIALAVADEVPKAQVWGTDVAADAVKLARKNAKMLDLTATFKRGDLFGALPKSLRGTVDVITLHPPYVPRDEIEDLPMRPRLGTRAHPHRPEHRRHGADPSHGRGVPCWLRKGGWLLMEVSPDRAKGVKKVFRHGGFDEVESTKGGELKVTRVIVGRRPR